MECLVSSHGFVWVTFFLGYCWPWSARKEGAEAASRVQRAANTTEEAFQETMSVLQHNFISE